MFIYLKRKKMKTIDKMDRIATELFQCEYRLLNNAGRDIVFEHYLAENATSVQPKSKSYNGYINLKKRELNEMDLEEYIQISYEKICQDYDIQTGDISPYQQSRIDGAISEINKVLNEFINQNK